MSLKVIYITHYPEYMGANRALFELVCSLRDSKFVDPIVIIPKEGEFNEILEKAGVKTLIYKSFINAYSKSSPLKTIRNLLRLSINHVKNHFFASCLAKELKDSGYQIVHSNSSATNFGALLANKLDIPHIWHFRENWHGHYNVKFLRGYKHQLQFYNKHSTKIIAISKYIYQTFSPLMSVGKISLIYDGMPYKVPIKPKLRNFGKDNPLKICSVGLIHPSKQQHLIIDAINKVIKSGNTNIKLYIVSHISENDPYYKSLLSFIHKNNLENYVIFTGYKPDAAEFIKSMDIGIIASKDEAFGRVTIEYMQAGLLPLGFDSGATPEIINHSANGYLFNSAFDLAELLNNLLKNPDLLFQLKSQAIIDANNFPLSDTTHKVNELYVQTIKNISNEDYRRYRML